MTVRNSPPQRTQRLLLAVLALMAPIALVAQGPLEPASLLKMPTDSWPTYHGDYSGRRYSTLTQINSDNVRTLTLAWVYRLNTSQALANIGGDGPDVPPVAAATQSEISSLFIIFNKTSKR